ncbi:cell surface protein [Flavobacteriales bacterium ALC-1]|nr:cell surface protein [Flavobacteriales bacterium ALC-1]
MKKQLLILIALFISIIGYSQTFTYNNLTYSISSTTPNTVTVIGYNIAAGTDVNIPASVTPSSSSRGVSSTTYDVTSIGYQAFYNMGITSVTIPTSVTSIGTDAFRNNSLTTVILPEGLTVIKNSCFFNNQLTNTITIPNSVLEIESQAFRLNSIDNVVFGNNITTIGFSAFSSNNISSVNIPQSVTLIDARAFDVNQLTNITIPSNVATIGFKAFSGNPLTCVVSEALTPATVTTGTDDSFGDRSNINLSIPSSTASAYAAATWTDFDTVAEGLTGTFIIDNITYQINPTPNNEVTVTDYDTAGGTDVTIPATVNSGCTTFSVTSIGNAAFNNKQLTSVFIPNSVTEIKNAAFYQNQLTNINIPNSVTSIGTQAFRSNLLINITVSSNLTNLNSFVFADNQITGVTFSGNSITTIGSSAFEDNQLQSFNIPSSVTSIGDEAFKNNLLTSITIPGNITIISDSAFYNNQLTTVNILNGVTTIESAAFSQNQITSVTFPDSITTIGSNAFSFNQLTSVNIPNSVTTIEQVAFFTNQLTSVIIPENVTSIGFWAFDANPLTDVTSLAATPPTIATIGINNTNDTFSASNRGNIHLHIPAGTMDAYVNDPGALWIGFNPVTEDALLSTNNFNLDNEVSIYNTKEELRVISRGSAILENYTLYSISGAKIKEGLESSIAIDAISKGIYIIELNFDKGRLVKKFIK